tara:strand:+ start:1719 stop:2603 length:885 start_codon:yes stop_codon:yes gene_type:complete
MNFSQLRFVKATAELSSFSQAAEICNVTQPTLSNGIAKLEQELGEKIFERTTRHVNLTTFGQQLLPTLLSILRLEEVAHHTAKSFTLPDTVMIKMGMSPLLNPHIISMLTTSFQAQNPHYQVVLIEENLDILERKLTEKEFDLILVPKVHRTKQRQRLTLYKEALYLVEQHADQDENIDINAIREKTFVMVPDSCGLSEITRSLIQTSRHSIKEYQGKAMSYQVLVDWASHGFGAAILPKSKIPSDKPKQRLVKGKQAMTISFEAQWLSKDNAPISNLIEYFDRNIGNINDGIL